jgi:hypothetical protein
LFKNKEIEPKRSLKNARNIIKSIIRNILINIINCRTDKIRKNKANGNNDEK